MREAVRLRSESWIGCSYGTRVVVFWGRHPGQGIVGRFKKALWFRLQNVKYLCAYDLQDHHLKRHVEDIRRFRPEFIISYVTPLCDLAALIQREELFVSGLRGIVTGAEKLFEHQKKLLEQVFQCPVYNRYGCSEVMNVAGECLAREGMHLNLDTLVIEFIGRDGRPVRPGQEGEIVITDLHNYGMPFIRYRVKDYAVPGNKLCSCGRGLPLMTDLLGRENTLIRTPDGRRVPDNILTFLFEAAEARGVQHCQLIQERLDELVVRLVPGSGYSSATGRYLCAALQKQLGPQLKLRLDLTSQIPALPSGKRSYTLSLLDHS
jgi:phenylacetate-CoA ligase